MAFETSAVYWVGVLLIFVYALERFNTPPTNRPSTTWMRYHVAALVYVGLFEITFALIVRYPQLIEYVRAVGPEMTDDTCAWLYGDGLGRSRRSDRGGEFCPHTELHRYRHRLDRVRAASGP